MKTQLTNNVAEFLKSPVQHWIGGRSKPSAGGATAQVLNPSTGSPPA